MFIRKNILKVFIEIGVGLMTTAVISNSAKAEVKIRDICHRDQCFQLYFINKTKSGETELGQLYSVNLEQRNLSTGEVLWAYQNQVFCSTSRPAVTQRYNRNEDFYVDFINPGEPPVSHLMIPTYAVYWATCHNFISSFGSREQARNFGYPLNHYERQERMRSLNQLIYR